MLVLGLLDGFSIGWYKKCESFSLSAVSFERENCSNAEAVQKIDSTLVLLLRGTVNGSKYQDDICK